jgi:hypothetical protein
MNETDDPYLIEPEMIPFTVVEVPGGRPFGGEVARWWMLGPEGMCFQAADTLEQVCAIVVWADAYEETCEDCHCHA